MWSKSHDQKPPVGSESHKQKCWDAPCVSNVAKSLLDECSNSFSRAHLLAASCKESGAWLNALPISSLGLRLDDDTVRIAVGLRFGIPICKPHTCCMCGANVDCTATHGLSCRRSPSRHNCHVAINNIIHSALSAAHIPSHLEPSGLDRSDGKHPDGVTIVPWKHEKSLVWDTTCPDTFAPSYLSRSTRGSGLVAELAEKKKNSKYGYLEQAIYFAL